MKKSILYLVLIALFFSCSTEKPEVRGIININDNWKFLEDSTISAHTLAFDDSGWRTLNLPHDWSMEDYPVQDLLHMGPFFNVPEYGHDAGQLRGGTGWYRKKLVLEKEHAGKEVVLYFDGIQTESIIYVNGQEVGLHKNGYTPFYYNITPYLNDAGEENLIAIKVNVPQPNSRWFTGAGMYRDVTLYILDPVHVDIWGVHISTPYCSPEKAMVELEVKLNNFRQENAESRIEAEIIAPDKTSLRLPDLEVVQGKNKQDTIQFAFDLLNPMLWDIDNPHLYQLVLSAYKNDRLVDKHSEYFGVRKIEFSANEGFLLNGRRVLLKGANIHHDNGLLGAAAFPKAEERKVLLLKENGFNAIRSAHNPPSAHLLEACARHGMLLINEAFDMWAKPKRPNDYHQYFNEYWEKDLAAMILSSRNNPAIIMWSIGNEIEERAQPMGLEIGRKLRDHAKTLDSSRPITKGVNDTWDNPGMSWDDLHATFDQIDVCGYNYQLNKYEPDHQKYPGRIMYGSETFPREAYENLEAMKKLPYVLGEFVWTGMDYLGEAGVAKSSYQSSLDTIEPFHMMWPWYIAWMGDIDITGIKKPQSFYRDVVWGIRKLEMLVHEPIPSGMHEQVFYWGWPKEFKSWNWDGHEGKELIVNVYSTYPTVRLELNGKSFATAELNEENEYSRNFTLPIRWLPDDTTGNYPKLTASFLVPYEPGEIRAIGLENGIEKESQTIQTSGPIAGLRLIPEENTIRARSSEIVYIHVEAIDLEGNLVPNCNSSVNVLVKGEGNLIAAGNGSPFISGSVQDNKLDLFNGRGLIIARSDGKPGIIEIQVDVPNGPSTKTQITAKR
jgi:beta-galactosidase